MKKKLIGFPQILLDRIDVYAEREKIDFTKAVRSLIEAGLNSTNTDNVEEVGEPDGPDLITLAKEIEKLKENSGWFQADDTQHKLNNMGVELNELKTTVEEIEKRVNVAIASAKIFKGHISNRSLHMQD